MLLKGTWRNYPLRGDVLKTGAFRERLAVGAAGQVWLTVELSRVATFDGASTTDSETIGLLYLEHDSWTFYEIKELPGKENHVFGLACDPSSRVWLYDVFNSISCFDRESFLVFREGEEGLPMDFGHIAALNTDPFAIEATGIVWLAMGAAGVYRYDGVQWLRFPVERHVRVYGSVEKVTVAQDGTVWFALYQSELLHLARYDGSTCRIIATRPVGERYNGISALAIDHTTSIWLGWQFVDAGLWRYDASAQVWKHYTRENSALERDAVDSIAVDSQNRVWVGNSEGVTVFAGEQSICWHGVTPKGPFALPPRTMPSKISPRERALQELTAVVDPQDSDSCIFTKGKLVTDEKGRVWLMSHNGVCVYSHNYPRVLEKEE